MMPFFFLRDHSPDELHQLFIRSATAHQRMQKRFAVHRIVTNGIGWGHSVGNDAGLIAADNADILVAQPIGANLV